MILTKAFFFRKVKEVMEAAIVSMYTFMMESSGGPDVDFENVTECYSGGERTEDTTVSEVSQHGDPTGGSVEMDEWRLHAQHVSYVVSTSMTTVDEKVRLC